MLLVALAGYCSAAQLDALDVTHDGARYTVTMQVRLDVPAAAAYRVMTDFPHLAQINRNITVSQPLSGNRLHTVVQMCVAFFCRDLDQLQRVQEDPPDALEMDVIPAQSDLRYGHAEWHFTPLGTTQSRMRFKAVLEPDFWVPPLIGPWLIRKKLKQQARQTASGIEQAVHKRGY